MYIEVSGFCFGITRRRFTFLPRPGHTHCSHTRRPWLPTSFLPSSLPYIDGISTRQTRSIINTTFFPPSSAPKRGITHHFRSWPINVFLFRHDFFPASQVTQVASRNRTLLMIPGQVRVSQPHHSDANPPRCWWVICHVINAVMFIRICKFFFPPSSL